MDAIWHLRVRAVVYENGKFLLCKETGGDYCFLPGGHVENGESAPAALEPEILEETGRKCEIKEYLGAAENAWIKNDVPNWEILHFFRVSIPDSKTNPGIISPEDDIEFFWASPEEFEKINLLPVFTREILKKWAEGDRSVWWGSNMK